MISDDTFSAFAARLRDFIARPSVADETFNQLALELFNLQFAHNAPYRKFCEARGVGPRTISRWTDIPAISTAAFKEFELTSLPVAKRTTVFHSSGTTEHRPSRHFHNAESLALYESSLLPWYQAQLLAEQRQPLRHLALTPPPAQAPHSSLVHMFSTLKKEFSTRNSEFLGRLDNDGAWALDIEKTLRVLNDVVHASQPIVLLGTAFSFVHLLDYCQTQQLRFALPPGSRVLETGGYKGRSRTMPKAELHALIARYLGVPTDNIICEYGMSELSSQAYDRVADAQDSRRRFRFPLWARVRIISPETAKPVVEGETGLIQVYDLANVRSVMAVQTEDLGVQYSDGFELVGRAVASEPRGCSLMAN